MDFITVLLVLKGFAIILVIVDWLSKFYHFLPMKIEFNDIMVAEAFISNVVKLHGIPKSIVTDRDKVFLSNFLEAFIQIQGNHTVYVNWLQSIN